MKMINNNNLLQDMARASDLLKEFDAWAVFTHKNADGDTLGTASALIEAGLNANKKIKWFGPDAQIPNSYKFIKNSEIYTPCLDKFKFDNQDVLYVFVDCANETRSVEIDESINLNDFKILNIDHHEDNTRFGFVNCVEANASSTAEIMTLLLKAGGWDITLDIAKSLYTGMWTDTGGFAFSSTSARTHRLAAELIELGVDAGEMTDAITQTKDTPGMALWGRALERIKIFGDNKNFALSYIYAKDFEETGAVQANTEGLPACLMTLAGVKVAAFMNEMPNNCVKLSLRSRPYKFSAADIARALGGGGHPRAAGAIIHDAKLDEVIDKIKSMMLELDK